MTESRSLRRWPAAGVAAVVIAVTLAGCGHSARIGAAGTLRVALREYRLTPSRVQAPTGPLTIYIHNYGRLTHNLVITSPSGVRDAVSDPVAPGHSGTLVADLSPGSYTISSSILSDKQLGISGTLRIG